MDISKTSVFEKIKNGKIRELEEKIEKLLWKFMDELGSIDRAFYRYSRKTIGENILTVLLEKIFCFGKRTDATIGCFNGLPKKDIDENYEKLLDEIAENQTLSHLESFIALVQAGDEQ
ncbi:hypothetical protein NO1_0567 [Candidatus Termititenax aidoneus]|uniref:Uncharacterized protein n=1 Tax=Termititenax aidoneus TaxID=2218524 RepID=A0A388T933_TERA1|nr:hypothetical protein NO1_0567 [Candidatus Termititenax aidoneus]